MGYLPPPIPVPVNLMSDGSIMSGVSGTLVANRVYLYAVDVITPMTIHFMSCFSGSTTTGTVDMGIYDSGGNLLGHTGAIANVASTRSLNALIADVTLLPGIYYLALCPSNSTDTYFRAGGGGGTSQNTRIRQSTTNGSAGVLPNATGGSSSATVMPGISAIPVGGLS